MIHPVQSVLEDKKFFIFDLDGTLIELRQNQLQGIWSIVKNYTPEKTINYQMLLDAFDKKVEINRPSRYEIYIAHGLCKNVEECESVDKYYWEGVGSTFKWMESAEVVLAALKKEGKHLSIVTNGESVQRRKIDLIKAAIDPSVIDFDYAEVTGDYGKEKYKPNPYCLEKIIRNYGADKNECVYIGDTIEKDHGMALNAGVDFILFDPSETNFNFEGPRIFDLTELLCNTI